jgi:hypothetical protein
MAPYYNNQNITTLQDKGGVMLFTIEKPDRCYRGMVLLSSVKDAQRTRIVCMKQYRYINNI